MNGMGGGGRRGGVGEWVDFDYAWSGGEVSRGVWVRSGKDAGVKM